MKFKSHWIYFFKISNLDRLMTLTLTLNPACRRPPVTQCCAFLI